ncbi:lysylphosphatidylglycerol synthase transmembrane domain-containing protein [Catelliglobosispora koreensis]|uniref:lysylphosphatidylglycerol synthase transmembrane domain-containing protein n=1 Tax=Catelliglobosispora koreensis TaxID=129052 RepID=UPI00037E9B67|nr:lysylphosphatidylglycerol synthase transmembrane domain-containing protein [Catelliglobosispora koreensis]
MEPEPRQSGTGKREKIIWLAGLAGVVIVAVWVLPRVASYSDIANAIGTLSSGEIVTLFALGLGVIAVTGWSAKLALGSLSWWRGTLSTVCANFLTALVPTGADLAVRFAMYRSWGFNASKVTAAIAVTGVGRYLTLLSLPLIGMTVLVLTGRGDDDTPLLLAVGLLAFALLTIIPWLLLRREDLAHRFAHRLEHAVHKMAKLFKRPAPSGITERVLRLHTLIVKEFKRRGWLVTFGQLAAAFANSVVLFAALRFVGLGPELISWGETFYAFALGTIAAIVPITPGNIGVTEFIILGVLALDGGNYQAQILAAALLYRIFTWMLPIPLGAATFFWWRYQQARAPAKLKRPSSAAESASTP